MTQNTDITPYIWRLNPAPLPCCKLSSVWILLRLPSCLCLCCCYGWCTPPTLTPTRALLRWTHCTLNQPGTFCCLFHPVWRLRREARLCDALTPVIVSPKCKAVAPSCGQVFSWEFYSAGLRRSFRLSRKDRSGSLGGGATPDPTDPDFATYEEVTRYQHRPNERPRLVVLIGSLGARINELKQKVIAENPHRYAVAVPHTTRPKKPHEKEGVEYHFVTKQAFDADALSNKFIEHGEYKENQYGTSIEAIRSVQAKNKMCLVDVQPEALKTLRTSEFKPYVIFVKPRVPESRCRRSAATSPAGGDHGRVTDEDLQEMRQSAQQMDQQYGHLVDRVLIKEDSASACTELRGILERLERETFWVPLCWVRN